MFDKFLHASLGRQALGAFSCRSARDLSNSAILVSQARRTAYCEALPAMGSLRAQKKSAVSNAIRRPSSARNGYENSFNYRDGQSIIE